MKNIHIISTDKPSRLFEIDGHLIINREQLIQPKYYRNIYITSDEEIKKGDWCLWISQNKIIKCTDNSLRDRQDMVRKIILTTDVDLITDGVQAIPDKFLEWFCKNSSCEKVTVTNLYGDFNPIKYDYKIIIPKEEPKQETLEEAAENYARKQCDDMYDDEGLTGANWGWEVALDFKKGAKWQQERSYSEEEVKNMLIDMSIYINTKELKDDSDTNFNEWVRKRDWFMSYLFEQFKKK